MKLPTATKHARWSLLTCPWSLFWAMRDGIKIYDSTVGPRFPDWMMASTDASDFHAWLDFPCGQWLICYLKGAPMHRRKPVLCASPVKRGSHCTDTRIYAGGYCAITDGQALFLLRPAWRTLSCLTGTPGRCWPDWHTWVSWWVCCQNNWDWPSRDKRGWSMTAAIWSRHGRRTAVCPTSLVINIAVLGQRSFQHFSKKFFTPTLNNKSNNIRSS